LFSPPNNETTMKKVNFYPSKLIRVALRRKKRKNGEDIPRILYFVNG
jgi:hypothetical protein